MLRSDRVVHKTIHRAGCGASIGISIFAHAGEVPLKVVANHLSYFSEREDTSLEASAS